MDVSFRERLVAFELKIRRKEYFSTHALAEQSFKLIQSSFQNCTSNQETEAAVRSVTRHICESFPNDMIFRNICQLVIVKLDEEIAAIIPKNKRAIQKSQSVSFLEKMMPEAQAMNEETTQGQNGSNDLKGNMFEVLDNLMDELSHSYQGIAEDVDDYLHTNDLILTLGMSNSVINFLTATTVKITVIIPERAPEYDGIKMASVLREKGIPVIVIPDSAVFAIIPKINTVILPARTVMANGGITAYSLSHSVALAAKRYSKPVIVLFWEQKLTSEMYHPGESYTILRQPNQIIEKHSPDETNVIAINPEGDYVPPELITLMIDETGPHCTGDIFSIVQANYYGDDR